MLVVLGVMTTACSSKGPVAVVNGTEISLSDFEKTVATYKESVTQMYGDTMWEAEIGDGIKYKDELKKSILNQMIQEEVVYQDAKKENLEAKQSDVDSKFKQLKASIEKDTDYAKFLKDNNIDALLLDVDNTLSVAHGNKALKNGVPEWLSLMRENDVPMMILSNAKTKRAKLFADSVALDVIGMSAKPLPFGYIKAVRKLRLKRKNVAMVGDQIFTDVLGANLYGIKSFLTRPVLLENGVSFKIRRYFEKKLLKDKF